MNHLVYSLSITCLEESNLILALFFFLLAFLYYFVLNYFKQSNFRDLLDDIHIFNLFILITIGIIMLLEGKLLIAALALETLGLALLANRLNNKFIKFIANLLFFIIIIWIVNRIFLTEPRGLVIVNRRTLFDLFIILCGLIFSLINKGIFINYIYRIFFSHIAIFALLWRDLAPISYQLLLAIFIIVALITKVVALQSKDKILKISTNCILFTLSIVIFIRLLIMIGFQILSSGFISGIPFLNLTAIIDIFFIITLLIVSFFIEAKKVSLTFKNVSIVLSFGVLFRELAILDYNYVLISWFVFLGLIFSLVKRYTYLKSLAITFFVLLTTWIGGRILLQSSEYPIFNLSSMVNLLFIMLTVFIAKVINTREKENYYMIANFLFIAFLFREFSYFAYLAIAGAWLLDGLIIYYLATRKKMDYLKIQSYLVFFGTIGIIVFKLFNLIFN